MGCGDSFGTLNSGGIDSSDRARYSGVSTSCRINSFPSAAMRTSNSSGRKHGVSDTRNPMGTPHRSASSLSSSGYFSALYFELNDRRKEGIMTEECSAAAPPADELNHSIGCGARRNFVANVPRHFLLRSFPHFAAFLCDLSAEVFFGAPEASVRKDLSQRPITDEQRA